MSNLGVVLLCVITIFQLVRTRKQSYQRDLIPYNLEELCPVVPGHSRPPPKLLKYIRWLHSPKTGTSFGTCLIHYACPLLPGNLYPHKYTMEELRQLNSSANPSEIMRFFLEQYKTKEYCPGDVRLIKMWGHKTLKPIEIKKGGIVGLFRDPRIRDYSEYLVHGHIGTNRHPSDLKHYVAMYRSCQTKMLVKKPCNRPKNPDYWFYNATRNEIDEAISLLRSEKMAFVGITDYWKESICLFHAMFGGNITEHEFTNMRPGVQATQTPARREHPGVMHVQAEDDPADWEIFKAATEIFVRRLITYGIQVPPSLKNAMSMQKTPTKGFFENTSSNDDDDGDDDGDDDDDDDDEL